MLSDESSIIVPDEDLTSVPLGKVESTVLKAVVPGLRLIIEVGCPVVGSTNAGFVTSTASKAGRCTEAHSS